MRSKTYYVGVSEPEQRNDLEDLLQADKKRCNLRALPKPLLEDINVGHWDLYWPKDKQPAEKYYKKAEASQEYVGRDPKQDIRKGVAVAIDFGTSSTVVAVRVDGKRKLIRIGAGGLSQNVKNPFENPTVLNFEHIKNLLAAWNDVPFRPAISSDDAQCSHQAKGEFVRRVRSGLAYLKTWAKRRPTDPPVGLVDENKTELWLAPSENAPGIAIEEDFQASPETLNPLELYAYYLGLHLNNQLTGNGQIYTLYYMTFPVKFSREIKDRILASFRRGLLRSLPPSLIYATDFKPEDLTVEEYANEPAAFAAAVLPLVRVESPSLPTGTDVEEWALKFLGERRDAEDKESAELMQQSRQIIQRSIPPLRAQEAEEFIRRIKEKLVIHEAASPKATLEPTSSGVPFGVFDFGGGTTDYTIGIYRTPTPEEEETEGWEQVVDIYDSSGDANLGGENLVHHLAFLVALHNKDKLMTDDSVIPFLKSPDADNLTGEREEPMFTAESAIARANTQKLMERMRPRWEDSEHFEMEGDQITLDFTTEDGEERRNISLQVPEEEIQKYLKGRIKKAVKEFFQLVDQGLGHIPADHIYVLLGGNSSKSPLVWECFEEMKAARQKDDRTKANIYVRAPLTGNPEDPGAVTGKTGVAMGLLETVPGEATGLIMPPTREDEAPFAYCVGALAQKKLKPILKRNAPYGEWEVFGKVPNSGVVYVLYSTSPAAQAGEVVRGSCPEERMDFGGENAGRVIYIAPLKPDTVGLLLDGDSEEAIVPLRLKQA